MGWLSLATSFIRPDHFSVSREDSSKASRLALSRDSSRQSQGCRGTLPQKRFSSALISCRMGSWTPDSLISARMRNASFRHQYELSSYRAPPLPRSCGASSGMTGLNGVRQGEDPPVTKIRKPEAASSSTTREPVVCDFLTKGSCPPARRDTPDR